MQKKTIKLDSVHHTISVNGHTVVLQQKAFEVLRLVIESAPEVVSRQTLIDKVWNGNQWTGEKGLNQAIWSIRSALNDDAKTPTYIKTIPRQGYQWLQVELKQPSRVPQGIAASFLVMLVATVVGVLLRADSEATTIKGTHAYLDGDQIVVDLASGCKGILKPSGIKKLGVPVLSVDGKYVAFQLTEAAHCRLVTVELASGKRRDFGACPVG